MTISVEQAKERLDYVISIARSDMYKPIQVAEVLYHSRVADADIEILNRETYQNPSVHWRNEVTRRLTGKYSTSSVRYQHDIWNETAISPDFLYVLDQENKKANGSVERYIYLQYQNKHTTIVNMITSIVRATPQDFSLRELLSVFFTQSGMRRSIDKAYEIVVYSLFETVINALEAKISIHVPDEKHALLSEFANLAKILLGVDTSNPSWETQAHVYRVGVTNAADRGLDMWANFGPAVQIKHITLNEKLAQRIIDQIEGDHIVIVCRDADKATIEVILKQISWGRRIQGIVTEDDLVAWYEKCLRGTFAADLGQRLLDLLVVHFKKEFPQVETLIEFLQERSYTTIDPPDLWKIDSTSTHVSN